MPIENNLERIANALEALVAQRAGADVKVADTTTPAVQQPAVQQPATSNQQYSNQQYSNQQYSNQQYSNQQYSNQQPAVQQPAVQQPAVQQPAMTVEQLNAELVKEFQRLGGRDGIDAAIKELNNGNPSVTTLAPALFGQLLEKVRAL